MKKHGIIFQQFNTIEESIKNVSKLHLKGDPHQEPYWKKHMKNSMKRVFHTEIIHRSKINLS
ncbi:MAG TPA: hypothetical protein PKV35_03245, partial [bacterium]|nr:hypothetical protein [bacterium]